MAIVMVTMLASRIMKRAIARGFQVRGVTDTGTIALVTKLVHYVVMAVGLGIALQTVGVDLNALFAAGAVFAVGIGFAMQNVVQNFVSGIILMVERTIKPGDVLDVAGTIIRVQKMGIRSTLGEGLDGEDLLLPNSLLVQDTVKNMTHQSADYRVRVPVGVAYESDMAQVQTALEAVAKKLHDPKTKGEALVLMTAFGSSSVDFEVCVWTKDPWRIRPLRSRIHHAIWDALKDADVVIAFPQLDVHFDPGVIEPKIAA
jgi:small-conductance mechanosensitive channel